MTAARPDTWMPWHIAKYLADTMHLTTEQHGAYLLLLAAGWMRGGQLADDDGQLAAIARLPLKRWLAMRDTVAAFYTVSAGTWRQKRQIEELEKATALTNARSEAGKRGGRPKANYKQTESPALANGTANEKQGVTPIPLPSPPAIPLSESLSSTSSAIGAGRSGKMMKVGSVISGSEGTKWGEQQARDEFAVTACIPHLPGGDDGQRWALALAAEDPAAENHVAACRAMSKAAKAAGVGWVSPERRARA